MKEYKILAIFTLRLSLIWLIGFAMYRIIFIHHYSDIINWEFLVSSLFIGIRFDVGIVLLLCILILISYTITDRLWSLYSRTWLFFILMIIHLVILFTYIVDFNLYHHWQSIFNIRAANYLKNINTILPYISVRQYILGMVCALSISYIMYYFTERIVLRRYYTSPIRIRSLIFFLIILSGVTFVVLRGGIREIPLNQSDAYVCHDKVYTIGAINSVWNFASTYINHSHFIDKNPYHILPSDSVETAIRWLKTSGSDEKKEIIQYDSSPSVILITMEGISAQLLKIHNQRESRMPYLESMIDSGYYFQQCYSSGFRTEQGLTAILSGLLTTPRSNLTDNIANHDDLPSILSSFRKSGYRTCFLFGGDLEFANMKSFLRNKEFQKLIDINNFDIKEKTQSLGVDDKNIFAKAFQEVTNLKKGAPYFLQIMTQSTHEPFDIPINKNVQDEEAKYLNSALFLDSCIMEFVTKLINQNLLSNTILIITSDHAHQYPGRIDIAHPDRYHIPFLIYSPLLTKSSIGYKDTSLFSQINTPATLSYLLKFKEKNYSKFSHNHFSTCPKWSFSTFVEGYVYMEDGMVLTHEYYWGKNNFKDPNLLYQHRKPLSLMQYITDQVRGVRPIKD